MISRVARKYELKRRAERQEETRRRIVEAAVELHGSIGPDRTTVSAIAERAGVQRHTFYRHFRDERELGLACSGLYMARNPLPDPERWRELPAGEERLRHALGELYAYYERNEPMMANVLRAAEVDELSREVLEIRAGATIRCMHEVLSEGFARRGKRRARLAAAVALALDFRTWQLLVRRAGLALDDAVEVGVAAVACQ